MLIPGGVAALATGVAVHTAGELGNQASGHPVEFWLTVSTAVGLVSAGWLCVVLRAVNALCATAKDPSWRVAVVTARVSGVDVAFRDSVRFDLWRMSRAGTWPAERLSMGDWTAWGSLLGASFGIIVYATQGSTA